MGEKKLVGYVTSPIVIQVLAKSLQVLHFEATEFSSCRRLG